MKIVFNYIQSGGVYYYINGLANAFASSGHKVYFIPASEQERILDHFNRIESDKEPIDLFIGSANKSLLTRALKKAIKARPKMKVGLYAEAHPNSPVGKIAPTRPDLIYDVANEETIKNIDEIAQYIDFLFIHHHQDAAHGYLTGWENHVKSWHGIGMACDIVLYDQGTHRDDLVCDASMISGFWEYKGRRLSRWVYPLCNNVDLNIKIFGHGWSVIQGLGPIDEKYASSVWRNTKVNLQIHEPQCELGFECSERTFKVIGTGNFLISDYVESLTKDYFLEDEIVTARTASEFHEKVLHYIARPEERLSFIEKGQRRVLSDHTYHDRAGDILSILRCHDDTHKLDVIKEQIIRQKFLPDFKSEWT